MQLLIADKCGLRVVPVVMLLVASVSAWAPGAQERRARSPLRVQFTAVPAAATRVWSPLHMNSSENDKDINGFDPLELSSETAESDRVKRLLLIASAALFTPTVASAATAAPIPSALAAYGHFLSLMTISACIMAERVTIKPNMSEEEEDIVAIADTVLGVAGIVLAYTGYLRVVQYGKGWDFYAHEPIFWLKISFVGVFGAASFFNTIKIIQLAVNKRNGNRTPVSEKLAARMIQICNAELLALASIPLTASLMARGVGYTDSIPWQIGAAVSVLVFGGLSFKYVKEALTWEEDTIVVDE